MVPGRRQIRLFNHDNLCIMKIVVFTRSRNEELYNRMRGLIPKDVECIRLTGFNEWFEADDYLLDVLAHAKDDTWCINIDEDCFIQDWQQVLWIIEYMKRNGYTHAGVGEYSVEHRKHNWPWVMNPFFNIFAPVWAGKLKAAWATTDTVEPYNWLFAYMNAIGTAFYFDVQSAFDEFTTQVYFMNKPICVHTWYSRDYPQNDYHRARIDYVYYNAKK